MLSLSGHNERLFTSFFSSQKTLIDPDLSPKGTQNIDEESFYVSTSIVILRTKLCFRVQSISKINH